MGRKGAIVRIAVKNFGTYREVEMFPGPNLNLILGPNGTGKSTIVSAIVLGLGGNPKVIGRATQISDYVRQGCTDADVEIELDSGNDTQNVVIHRHFTSNNNSFWRLNGKNISPGEIMKVISSFRIQVSNLCQFLPQDKVQDFAKMNNQQLLINTQKSVGFANLTEMQDKLIQLRDVHKAREAQLKKQESTLQHIQQQNERLTGVVENMQEHKKLVLDLKYHEGKLAWVVYSKKRDKVLEIKKDKDTAEKSLLKYADKKKPLENELNGIKRTISVIQQQIAEKNRLASNAGEKASRTIEKNRDILLSVKTVQSALDAKIQEERQRQEFINEAKIKVNKCKTDLDSFNQRYGSVSEILQEIETIKPKLASIETQIEQLSVKKSTLDYKSDLLNSNITTLQHQKNMEENVAKHKLDLLRQVDEDAYKSVLWLRANKHLFRGNVYEPILLEINVTDRKNAKYLENIISLRELTVFTCELVEDTNLLIKKLRIEQKLRASVVHSGAQHPAYKNYTPTLPLNQIQKYGFYAYANTLLTGPETIMKYLCRSCRLHAIPIGDAHTYDLYEQIPPQINLFFSDKHRFAVSVSSYTREKSTRINEVTPNHLLELSVNVEAVNKINQEIRKFEEQKQGISREIKNIEDQIQNVIVNRNGLKNHRQELHSIIQQSKNAQSRLNSCELNLKALEQRVFDLDLEKAEARIKIKEILDKYNAGLDEIVLVLRKQKELTIDAELSKIELELSSSKITAITKQLHDVQKVYTQLENSLTNIKTELENCRLDAKQQFERAKVFTDGITPGDKVAFAKFDQIYDTLTSNTDSLTEKIRAIQIKIDCMSDVNDGVIKEYEDRLKQIANIEKENVELSTQVTQILNEINELKEQWLTPLNDLVSRINIRFGYYFECMSCKGEVSLVKADNELDFEEYGFSVKVSYRKDEPLQELDQYVQSGGERAVATAIYMLALQELTDVPFRCVDEINQGMDAINERKIFELIVNSTDRVDGAQYFLLTPKLLPNLKYTKTMKIHVIHNGPYENLGYQYDWKKIARAMQENSSQSNRSLSSSQS